jgi:3-methyladenine DNA glycosylase/8-oxoguanine DNA glycosylase
VVTRRQLDDASAALGAVDPVFARLVATYGPVRLGTPVRAPARYQELARAVSYQQLAGAAAAKIWGRVHELADGPVLTAERVLTLGEPPLRAAGLSGAKAASLLDLAAKVLDGTVELARMGRLPDDEVVAELTTVRGIGPWTAEMFLMFQLHRLDVWPVADFGVRAGYAAAHDLAEPPKPKALVDLGERYRPYRSLAAWYCWQVADNRPPVGAG